MIRCKDPIADLLRGYGYNLVTLPKQDILPLQLLAKNGRDLERVGHIKDLFLQGDSVPLPSISRDIPVAKEIENQQSLGIDMNVGVELLKNFLRRTPPPNQQGAAPGPPPTFGATFKDVDKVVFSFKNVVENSVDVVALDRYIHDARIDPNAKAFAKRLHGNELYVIVATLKSNSFSTEFTDTNGASVSVELPSIKGVIGGHVRVGGERSKGNKVVYEDEAQRVFGFKAVRLLPEDDGTFRLKSEQGVLLRGEEDYPTEHLADPDQIFMDL